MPLSPAKKIVGALAAILFVAFLAAVFLLPPDFFRRTRSDQVDQPDRPNVERDSAKPTPVPMPDREEWKSPVESVDVELAALDNASSIPLWGIAVPAPASGEYRFALLSGGQVLEGASGGVRFVAPVGGVEVDANPRPLPSGRLLFHHSGSLDRPAFFLPYYGGEVWDAHMLKPLNEAARLNFNSMEEDSTLAAVRGMVVDGQGNPVPNARIVALRNARSRISLIGGELGGSDGSFRLPLLPPGAALLAARAPGYRVSKTVGVQAQAGSEGGAVRIVLEKAVAIVGRVTSEGGSGIADASVSVGPRAGASTVFQSGFSARTDIQGAYMIDSLNPGVYTVTADHPDYSPETKSDVPLLESDIAVTVDIVLPEGGWLRGRVVQKVGGSDLGVVDAEVSGIGEGGVGARRTLSGEDGAFLLKGVPYDRSVSLRASKGLYEGVLPDGLTLKKGEEPESVELRLPEAGDIVGYTLDNNEKPVAGSRVTVMSAQTRGSGFVRSIDMKLMTTKSDAQGWFRFVDVPVDTVFRLRAEAEGFAPAEANNVIANGLDDVVLRMTRGGSISGRVVMADTNEAVPDVELMLRSVTNSTRATVRTDADGAFVFPNLMADRYSVVPGPSVAEEGKLVLTDLPNPMLAQDLDIKDLVIKAHPSLSLRGRVLLIETGEPVADAGVSANWLMPSVGGATMRNSSRVSSASDGTFEIRGLSSGRWRLSTQKSGLLSPPVVEPSPLGLADSEAAVDGKFASTLVELKIDESPAEVVLYLSQGGTVRGLVLDAAGKPRANAQTQCQALTQLDALNRLGFVQFQTQRTTDAEGRFVMTGVPLSDAELVVAVVRGAPATQSESFRVTESNPEADVTITLPTAASISGTAHFQDGTPVPNIAVYAQSVDGGANPVNSQGRTNAVGFYTLDNLGAGVYNVALAGGRDYGQSQIPNIQLAEGETKTGVDFTVEKSAAVTEGGPFQGVLSDLNARRLSGWQLRLSPEAGQEIRLKHMNIVSNHDGSFVFPSVPDGRYTLNVSQNALGLNQSYRSGAFEVSRLMVIFVVPTGGRARGRVVDLGSGSPITQAQVSIAFNRAGGTVNPEGTDLGLVNFNTAPVMVGPDGAQFDLRDLPLGGLSLRLSAEDAVQENPFEFYMDASLNVDLGDVPMIASYTIKARLVDGATGQALVRTPQMPMSLSIQAVHGQTNQTWVIPVQGPDAEGIITVNGLPTNTSLVRIISLHFLPKEIPMRSGTLGERDLGDVVLDLGVVLQGKVTGPNGEKASRANISLRLSDPSNANIAKSVATDADGIFRISGLRPGRATLTIIAPGHSNDWIPRNRSVRRQVEVEIHEGANAPLEITMPDYAEREGENPGGAAGGVPDGGRLIKVDEGSIIR